MSTLSTISLTADWPTSSWFRSNKPRDPTRPPASFPDSPLAPCAQGGRQAVSNKHCADAQSADATGFGGRGRRDGAPCCHGPGPSPGYTCLRGRRGLCAGESRQRDPVLA
eukprot:scaffold24589_cov113-Isochrysis_galbana.AAC.3